MRKHFLLYINNSTTNEISKTFLKVVHIVIHSGGDTGDIHRSLKCCIQNFKKYKISIFYKTNLKAERKAGILDNIILLKRYTYVQ